MAFCVGVKILLPVGNSITLSNGAECVLQALPLSCVHVNITCSSQGYPGSVRYTAQVAQVLSVTAVGRLLYAAPGTVGQDFAPPSCIQFQCFVVSAQFSCRHRTRITEQQTQTVVECLSRYIINRESLLAFGSGTTGPGG